MTRDRAAARLEELGGRHDLDDRQCDRLARLLAVLARDERAPTTARSRELAVDVHIADSLSALDLESVRAARRIADVGAGAGFPGAPVAVAVGDAAVSLIESQRRKCTFLTDALAEAGVANARVVCARAEEWQEGILANDVVLARAVGPQPVVLEYAAPLLRLGGTLVDWRGKRVPEEELASARAAAELGLELVSIDHVRPFEASRDRHVHVYAKVRETPVRFPRRAGVARKRPLGG
jgi:16S rRNA (guanine527-N7)-methyltransferase